MKKKAIIIFVILSAFEFFDLNILGPENQIRVFDSISIVLMVLILLFRFFRNDKTKTKMIFAPYIIIILFSVLLGMIGAFVFFKQDFLISLQVSRTMYYYLLYFVLIYFDLKIKDIEQILIITAALYCIAYVGNLFLPNLFFSKIVFDPNRALTRVYLPGSLMNVLAFFYSAWLFIKFKRVHYLPFVILSFIVILLTGSRIVILPVILVTLFLLMKEFKIKRILYQLLLIGIVVLIIFSFYEAFDLLINLAKSDVLSGGQAGQGTLFTRIEAAIYFYYVFFPSYLNILLGNGFASTQSYYGQMVDYFKLSLNFYQSDIGILGDFTKMGIFYIAGVILLFINAFKTRIQMSGNYLHYFFYYVLFTCIILSFFGSQDGIVTLCIAFYLIEKYHQDFNTNLI